MNRRKSALDSLSNEQLIEIYEAAIQREVSYDFIVLVRNVLLKRSIQVAPLT
ncbi:MULTISPECIES: sporulation histidine kinase inhibitor Sda [unclassified Paenibacillus]|uniref:sporulation histidine kinase inhibitor Sda n=1 Tax=unclassified Paenibacillus TaxID=185978 RepID=UPI002F42EC79